MRRDNSPLLAGRFRAAIATALSLLLLAVDAVAVDVPAAKPGVVPLGGSQILSVGVSTLIVIGAIVLVGWMYSRARFTSRGPNDLINVISARPLGAKERLLLVEVGGKQLLIGMTSVQVQTLHVFDAPITTNETPAAAVGFAQRLSAAIRGAGK